MQYDIVFQQNHVEIYKFHSDTYEKLPPRWLERENELTKDDLYDDECWLNNTHMPTKEKERAEKYLYTLGLTGVTSPDYFTQTFGASFIVTYCPSNNDTFGVDSPRSVNCLCYINGNALVIHALGLTQQGWLWEIHGGDDMDCNPRYRRVRENSTEPMLESFFLYILKNYPDVKYGAVQGSDGTRSLLEVWFELLSREYDDVAELLTGEVHEAEIFLLRTPYFESLLNKKKQKVDIQCHMCDSPAAFMCAGLCDIAFYCGKQCAAKSWKHHRLFCKISTKREVQLD